MAIPIDPDLARAEEERALLLTEGYDPSLDLLPIDEGFHRPWEEKFAVKVPPKAVAPLSSKPQSKVLLLFII